MGNSSGKLGAGDEVIFSTPDGRSHEAVVLNASSKGVTVQLADGSRTRLMRKEAKEQLKLVRSAAPSEPPARQEPARGVPAPRVADEDSEAANEHAGVLAGVGDAMARVASLATPRPASRKEERQADRPASRHRGRHGPAHTHHHPPSNPYRSAEPRETAQGTVAVPPPSLPPQPPVQPPVPGTSRQRDVHADQVGAMPAAPAASPAAALLQRQQSMLGRELFQAAIGSADSPEAAEPYTDAKVRIGDRMDLRRSKGWVVGVVQDLELESSMTPVVYISDERRPSRAYWLPFTSEKLAPLGRHTRYIHSYSTGDIVDAEDVFPSKRRPGTMIHKWRVCTVLDTRPKEVLIRWENWGPEWDCWINLDKEPERLAPPFTRSVAKQADEGETRAARFADGLLAATGLQMERMDADGNCLFRSIARQVYGSPEEHRRVRDEICDYVYKHKSHFEKFIAEPIDVYVAARREDGCWGDDIEIWAAEELYDCPVEIYAAEASDFAPLNTMHTVASSGVGQPIRVSYHGKSHYNAVLDPQHPPPIVAPRAGAIRSVRMRKGMLRRQSTHTALAQRLHSDSFNTDSIAEGGRSQRQGEAKLDDDDEEEEEVGPAPRPAIGRPSDRTSAPVRLRPQSTRVVQPTSHNMNWAAAGPAAESLTRHSAPRGGMPLAAPGFVPAPDLTREAEPTTLYTPPAPVLPAGAGVVRRC